MHQYDIMGKERFPIYSILGSCDQTLELLYKVATAKRTSLRHINSALLTSFTYKNKNDKKHQITDNFDCESPSPRTSVRKKRKTLSKYL